MPAERPNVLVIMTDQHNPSFMGCAGHPVARTPNLDRLAAEGTRFTGCYCASPWCVPSRMSFMTGRRPTNNHVWTNSHILSSGIPTWAHALGAAGYETALIGRMHFVGSDQRHGFELRPVGEFHARHPGEPERGGPRFAHYSGESQGQRRVAVEIAGHGHTDGQYLDEHVAEGAVAYLREKGRARGGRPFAAVASFWLPHCPFIAPKELFEAYLERVEVPREAVDPHETQPPTIRRFREHRDILRPFSEAQVRHARAAYHALCEHTDRNIGRVLGALDEAGLAEDTLVVYCSDHGEMAGEHGCWWKSSYYQNSAGVPLLARWPGRVPAGASSEAICNLLDLGPTFVELAGGEPLPFADGKSLAGIFQGARAENASRETFSELGPTWGDPPSCMIRRGRWKLWTYHDDLPPALFDLEADPDELNDLGSAPEHAELRADLLSRIGAVWDGARTLRETEALNAEMKVISAWGRAVKPAHPDNLPAPPPEYEGDVVLV
ncbi:MAG: sulfatase-like hydrolase/transferase [Planctomycetota bacterium]|nr:sulfatase-like hydrolase/transferase [Planctomycetota bacterium]